MVKSKQRYAYVSMRITVEAKKNLIKEAKKAKKKPSAYAREMFFIGFEKLTEATK